jgi:hypothetical protein
MNETIEFVADNNFKIPIGAEFFIGKHDMIKNLK